IGVFIYDNTEDLVPVTPSLGDNEASIPVVAITMEDGQKLKEEMANEEVNATLNIAEISDQQSQNVIAVKEPKGKPTNDDDIVYVTAHYDSVPYSPGQATMHQGQVSPLNWREFYSLSRQIKRFASSSLVQKKLASLDLSNM